MNISFDLAKLAKHKGFNTFNSSGIYLYNTYFHESDLFTQGSAENHVYKHHYYDLPEEIKDNKFEYCFLCAIQSELQKWLREEHNLNINIKHRTHSQTYCYDITSGYEEKSFSKVFHKFETYEKALEDALFESLNLI